MKISKTPDGPEPSGVFYFLPIVILSGYLGLVGSMVGAGAGAGLQDGW
jgi:hypothetical protein